MPLRFFVVLFFWGGQHPAEGLAQGPFLWGGGQHSQAEGPIICFGLGASIRQSVFGRGTRAP